MEGAEGDCEEGMVGEKKEGLWSEKEALREGKAMVDVKERRSEGRW